MSVRVKDCQLHIPETDPTFSTVVLERDQARAKEEAVKKSLADKQAKIRLVLDR
jgi:hypothetical protein